MFGPCLGIQVVGQRLKVLSGGCICYTFVFNFCYTMFLFLLKKDYQPNDRLVLAELKEEDMPMF